MAVVELPGPGAERRGAALPRRDAEARARLHEVADAARPTVLHAERVVPVGDALGTLLPAGGIVRGTTGSVDGTHGVTSAALMLAAATTAAGEWAVFVDDDATLGGLAALEAGVVVDRFAVVRDVPPGRWGAVVAALVEGVTMVLASPPARLGPGDARRLAARARAHDAILVPLGAWPAETDWRLAVEGVERRGLDAGGGGRLEPPSLRLRFDGRGVAGLTGRVAAAR